MTTNREPFVTDEQIEGIRAEQNAKFYTQIKRNGPAIHLAEQVRTLYEAELSRKDAEIEALRKLLSKAAE
jgi:hypothetical protein